MPVPYSSWKDLIMSTTSLQTVPYLGAGEVEGRYMAYAGQQSPASYNGWQRDFRKHQEKAAELTFCKTCKGFYPATMDECPDASNH